MMDFLLVYGVIFIQIGLGRAIASTIDLAYDPQLDIFSTKKHYHIGFIPRINGNSHHLSLSKLFLNYLLSSMW